MKKFLLLLPLLLLTMTVAADNASDARKILDKTAAVVNRKGGASAQFTISGGKIGSQTGNISIKGNKFCATTPSATMWYDGKTQWTYMKANNEVNISTPDARKQQMMNPYTFITLYKKGYNLSLKKQGKTNLVHMVAQGNASIKEMYITIDSSYHPTQIRMNQKGTWTTITISKFSAKNLSDAIFRFNSKDYPKAEVVDLR